MLVRREARAALEAQCTHTRARPRLFRVGAATYLPTHTRVPSRVLPGHAGGQRGGLLNALDQPRERIPALREHDVVL
jgi:hypothetical protein